MDGAIHAAATEKRAVGRIYNGVHFQAGDVTRYNAYPSHRICSMSFTNLNLLILLLLLIGFWRDSLRVREIATRICRNACESHGVQFLDQAVALHRLSLSWTRSGLRLKRTYQFDYSLEGQGRRTGYLVMLGSQHLSLHIELPEELVSQPERLH